MNRSRDMMPAGSGPGRDMHRGRRLLTLLGIGTLAAGALVPAVYAAGAMPGTRQPAISGPTMMGPGGHGQMMTGARMPRSSHGMTMRSASSDMGMGMGGGMMGAGMMSGSQTKMMGQGASITTPAAARALSQQAAATAAIDPRTNTIAYHGSAVTLVAIASPGGGPDMTWNVDGLVNPTVVIPRGAQVTMDVLDGDAGTMHGWELTTARPPYPAMVMMTAPIAFSGAFAMPVAGATTSHWHGRVVHFTAARSGTYFYLCPVPGHARSGMHGTLIVR